MREHDMLQLIETIYAAVTETDRWPQVLEAVSAQFSGAAILVGRMARGASCDLMMRHDFSPEPALAFQRIFGTERPPPFIAAFPQQPLATPLTPEAIESEEQFLESDVYRLVMRPHGLRYMTSAILHREPGWLTYCALWRGPDALPFEPDELERFAWIARHLGRAVALQYALEATSAAGALLADVIDRFDRGAIIVDSRGRTRLVNRMARTILERGDGLRLVGERLATVRQPEGAELLRLIAEAAATSAGDGADAGGVLAVTRLDGLRPYAVMVSPLSTAMLAGTSDRALALVLVVDPERRLPTQAQLMQLHGLTAAEARLAIRLLLDETPSEAAAALGVKVATVRYHLSNMLAKTGTRRQAELVAHLRATT